MRNIPVFLCIFLINIHSFKHINPIILWHLHINRTLNIPVLSNASYQSKTPTKNNKLIIINKIVRIRQLLLILFIHIAFYNQIKLRFYLTHLFLMHPFSTPCKHQQNLWFSNILKGQRKGVLGTNGFISDLYILILIYQSTCFYIYNSHNQSIQ